MSLCRSAQFECSGAGRVYENSARGCHRRGSGFLKSAGDATASENVDAGIGWRYRNTRSGNGIHDKGIDSREQTKQCGWLVRDIGLDPIGGGVAGNSRRRGCIARHRYYLLAAVTPVQVSIGSGVEATGL